MKKTPLLLLLPLLFFCAALSSFTFFQDQFPGYKKEHIADTKKYLVAIPQLKKDKRCNIVLCFMHDSYSCKKRNEILREQKWRKDRTMNSTILAFHDQAVLYKGKPGEDIMVSQVSRKGIVSVRQDFEFTKFSGQKSVKTHTISVSQKTGR